MWTSKAKALDLDQPIDKHTKKADKQYKHFGIEKRCNWFKKWYPWKWYHTEEKRDQAFDMLIKHTHFIRLGEVRWRKIER